MRLRGIQTRSKKRRGCAAARRWGSGRAAVVGIVGVLACWQSGILPERVSPLLGVAARANQQGRSRVCGK